MTAIKKIFFGLVLSLLFQSLTAQTGEIQIRFIGNCGFYMTDGTTDIYVDFPYKSGAHHYMKYDASELEKVKPNSILLFTHKHADHYSRKLVKRVKGEVYIPRNIRKTSELESRIADFSIEVFRTKHRFSFRHRSYLIQWHGKRFFISGDTEHPETIGKMKNIDYAFTPFWILSRAKEAGIAIDAKMKVLYHLYPNQKIEGEVPDDIIIFNEQGKTISVPW